MQFTSKLLIAALLGFAALSAPAQAIHTQVRLILAADTAKPGETVLAGVHMKMDPHWHVYWKNPGESGIATTVEWKLPGGITAGEILWPVPEKIPPAAITTYGYHNEVVLLVPLKLAANLPPGRHELKAEVTWLECKELCLNGSKELTATLEVGTETKPSDDADLIKTWQAKLPKPAEPVAPRVYWEGPATNDLRPMIVEWNSTAPADHVDFYPVDTPQFAVHSQTERLPADAGKISLRKQLKRFEGPWPKEVSGLLIQESGTDRLAYDATLAFPGAAGGPQVSRGSLLLNLFYAFIGGMILNVMPCVLPVISLKILGFVSEAGNDRRRLRRFGWLYALGILVSFLALALIAIGLKAAGQSVSWGMQFSNPYFLIAMTVLLTLIALNLFGVFEVSLGGRAMNAAAALSSRRGAAGAFFNGLLATVLASACTAPILGGALGFALPGTSYLAIFLMAIAAAAGLAAPYLLLTWQPAWLKFLPKPGVWMERFKVAMGFPMLATAVWLCSLVAIFYGERTWAFAIFLVVIALAAWVFGQFVQRSSRHRALAWTATLLLVATGYAFALEKHFRWREPVDEQAAAEPTAKSMAAITPEGANWQPWSQDLIAKARTENRPVLVDFTAKWCLTCQWNVKPVLGSEAVRKRLEELNAVTLLADYTRRPDELTQELYRFGRAGVPLVVVYPRDPAAEPIVLPEAITAGIVLDALDRAVQ